MVDSKRRWGMDQETINLLKAVLFNLNFHGQAGIPDILGIYLFDGMNLRES
jgi:hypothetical protein